MGYLNNSTRTLDAILTKRGREILAGDTGTAERVGFSITKFALGDDEIDYGLWDTSHAKGTDYYGAVLENLPPLEPFNDPSEIMKYKLVSRPKGTRAMPFIKKDSIKKDSSTLNIPTIQASYVHTGRSTVIAPNQIAVDIGHGVPLRPWKTHIDTAGTPIPTNWDTDTQNEALAEQYLITLLDVSVGILGPNIYETETTINEERFVEGNWLGWSGIYLDEQRIFFNKWHCSCSFRTTNKLIFHNFRRIIKWF